MTTDKPARNYQEVYCPSCGVVKADIMVCDLSKDTPRIKAKRMFLKCGWCYHTWELKASDYLPKEEAAE